MTGGTGPPYREPCGGWSPAILGSRYQHYDPSAKGSPAFENVSLVANYETAPPAGIPPYSRPSLADSYPICAEAPDCTAGNPKCGIWPKTERPNIGRYNNAYEAVPGSTYNRAVCQKIGWKGVQASVRWYGRASFTNRDGCVVPTNREDCGFCNFTTPVPVPEQVKYLTMAVDISFNYRGREQDIEFFTKHWQRTYSVHSQSGITTLDSCTTEGTYVNETTGQQHDLTVAQVEAPGDMLGLDQCGHNTYVEACKQANISQQNDPNVPYTPFTIVESLSEIDYHAVVKEISIDGVTVLSTATISFNLSNPMTAGDVYGDLVNMVASWPLDDDTLYPWRYDSYTTVMPSLTRNQLPFPASPDTWTDCLMQDKNGLNPGDTGYIPTGWKDPQTDNYDGQVLGLPNPASYGPHFDFDHKTNRSCVDDEDVRQYYVSHYGAYSGIGNNGDETDSVVPSNATRWTENQEAGGGLPFAFVQSTVGGVCILQKYAQIKVNRPSLNFFGPCGAQRFDMNQEMVRCISETSMSGTVATFTVDILRRGTPDDVEVGGTFRGRVCGISDDLDGVWTVTKVSADTYSIDTSEPRMDGGDAEDCTGIIGKLKWQNAWPICGRVKIESVRQLGGGIVEINLADSAPGLRTGDMALITGVTGLVRDGNSVTVNSDFQFTVTGSYSGEYTSGGYVSSPDAPAYYWNDTGFKGDFILFSAQHDFRDIAVQDQKIFDFTRCSCDAAPNPGAPLRNYQGSNGVPRSVKSISVVEGCLPFTPCCPSVICFSPNGEVFNNGITRGFDHGFTADDVYGSLQQWWVDTTMQDPYWQIPARTCEDGLESDTPLQMDDGSCADVDYAHFPVVEARASLPDGAPDMPLGLELQYLTLDQIDVSEITFPGKIIRVPQAPGLKTSDDALPPQRFETEWGLWIAQTGCVKNGGKFSSDYLEDGL